MHSYYKWGVIDIFSNGEHFLPLYNFLITNVSCCRFSIYLQFCHGGIFPILTWLFMRFFQSDQTLFAAADRACAPQMISELGCPSPVSMARKCAQQHRIGCRIANQHCCLQVQNRQGARLQLSFAASILTEIRDRPLPRYSRHHTFGLGPAHQHRFGSYLPSLLWQWQRV